MTDDLTPLALPADDWETWLGDRSSTQLDRARELVT